MRHLHSFNSWRNDSQFKDCIFKTCYPSMFERYHVEGIIDAVSREEYITKEANRIPIFIGSQFGIAPKPEDVELVFARNKYVAILSKSQLSGHVHGLRIIVVPPLYNLDSLDDVFSRKYTCKEYLNDVRPSYSD